MKKLIGGKYMSVEIPGDEEKDEIEFPNGMKIIIDYGQMPKDFDSFSTRYGGRLVELDYSTKPEN